jgi:glutathione peroxidase
MKWIPLVSQIVIALGLLNVWLLRAGKPSNWRGGSARSCGTVTRASFLAAVALAAGAALAADDAVLYGFTMKTIDGTPKSLGEYRGKALLIVNTASECGYTPQYAGLEKLYERYRDRGFTVLAFPANNFFGQEPGTDAQIKQFCSSRYGTQFDLFSKISVKGKDQHPLYAYLTNVKGFEGKITWNFNKFLVDPSGAVVARYPSGVEPTSSELTAKLESILPKK